MSSSGFNPFAAGEILRVAPTTNPQKEVFASAKMSDEANTAFNEGIILTISGTVDVARLDSALRALLARHDVLRTTFSRTGTEICLNESARFSLDFEDISHLSKAEIEGSINELKHHAATHSMNLEEGPLFFSWLKKLGDGQFMLLLLTHHLVCDGWSFGMLLKELAEIYRSGEASPDLPEAESFFDFAEEQDAKELFNLDAEYWMEKFATIPDTVDLPLDFRRPSFRSFTASRTDHELPSHLVTTVRSVAASMKASQVNLMLATYFALLHRLTGNSDIVVGLAIAGQASFNRLNQVGHLVQLLPIRIEIDEQTSFRDLVGKVKTAVLDATEHPNFTFGSLVRKSKVDRSRIPIVNTLFNIDQPMGTLNFGEFSAEVESLARKAENFELFLNFSQDEKAMVIETTYSTTLFDERSINAWLQSLEVMLETATSDPDLPIGEIPLSSKVPAEVVELNQTQREREFQDLVSVFKMRVVEDPKKVAIHSDGVETSYEQLEQFSDAIAQQLSNEGIGHGDIVGICIKRSANTIASILGIMKTGACYLPLDVRFPKGRLAFYLEDSRAKAIIADESTPNDIGAGELLQVRIDQLDSENLSPFDAYPSDPETPVYTIYTSGSTGKPKGVLISQSNLVNLLLSMAREPGCSAQDRWLAVTTITFDMSVPEVFLPIFVGATSAIVTEEQGRDGQLLSQLIDQFEPTILQATPSLWKLLIASEWGQKSETEPSPIRALTGGEPLAIALAAQLLPRVSEFWNMYGPTETTVWSSCKRIESLDEEITVGEPIDNTEVYILDEQHRPLPISVPGELCIGGAGVALGYLERKSLTAERFINHKQFGRLYKTGDIAKINPQGEIQILGRSDSQVKVRGYRVELGEIESALSQLQSIEEAVAYLWKLSWDDVRIVACCVTAEGTDLVTSEIRKSLRERLPGYMVPQYLLPIDQIPLLPNGKIDRNSLPKPEVNVSSILSRESLETLTELKIGTVWQELLGTSSEISKEDNFFELGGHSLLALEAIRRIEKQTGFRISIADIVAKNLATISQQIDSVEQDSIETAAGPVALPSQARRRLSPLQIQLLELQLEYPNSTVLNLPAAWELHGDLDLAVFNQSLNKVFERQTALRTRIVEDKGEYIQLLTHPDDFRNLEIEDLSSNPDSLSSAISDAHVLSAEPFTILDSALIRTRLYKLGDASYFFLIIPHQIVFDGWSFDLFIAELNAAYVSAVNKLPVATEPLLLEFRDIAEWMRQHDIGRETHLRMEDHSGSKHGRSVGVPKASSRSVERYGAEFTAAIESACAGMNVRLFDFFLTCFVTAMTEVLGREHVVVGIADSGRKGPEVMDLIGSFVQTSRQTFDLAEGFAENLQMISNRFSETTLQSDAGEIDSGDVPDTQDTSSDIDVDASYAFQDARNRSQMIDELDLKQIDIYRREVLYPVEFWTRISHSGFEITLEYSPGQISEEQVSKLQESMRDMVQSPPLQAGNLSPNSLDTDSIETGESGQAGFLNWKKWMN